MNIPTHTLKKALESVISAASEDGSRPVLEAVYWNCAGGHAILTAADGYMLTQRRVVASETDNAPMAGLLPIKAMEALLGLCDTSSAIQVSIVDGVWWFATMDVRLVVTPLTWTPPDYREVFTKFAALTPHIITVQRDLLVAALTQIGPRVTLRFAADDQPLLISSPDHRSMLMPMAGTPTSFDYLELLR